MKLVNKGHGRLILSKVCGCVIEREKEGERERETGRGRGREKERE